MSFKQAVILVLAVCLAGCAHGGAARPAARPAGDAPVVESARHAERARPAAPAASAVEDDFIEVDDKKGLKKTWPMLLFLGLLAVMAGTL